MWEHLNLMLQSDAFCLNKKLRITQQKDDNVLSKQTEVVSADTNTNITLHVPKLKTKKKPL